MVMVDGLAVDISSHLQSLTTQQTYLQEQPLLGLVSSSTISSVAAEKGVLLNGGIDKKIQSDKVKRVIDNTTLQLEKLGLVKLAGITSVRTPGGTTSACVDKSPSYKLRQLLPPKTPVEYQIISNRENSKPPRVLLFKTSTGELIQKSLIVSGFARLPPSSILSERIDLIRAQEQAIQQHRGLHAICNDSSEHKSDSFQEAEFEPMEYSTRTIFSEDGGRVVRVQRDNDVKEAPPNPGDIRGCSDFDVYEDALLYYERFYPYYGDVAKLDRDGDGVPCPKLPHTKNQDRYRMKKPTRN